MNPHYYTYPGLKFAPTVTRPYEETLNKVCDFYNVTIKQLQAKCRKRQFVVPRQIAMCALYGLNRWTFEQTGAFFLRDHTTAIHAINTIKDLTDTDSEFKAEVENIFPMLIPILRERKYYSPRSYYN